MKRPTKKACFLIFLLFSLPVFVFAEGNYKNFKASVYTRVYEVNRMSDPEWLEKSWREISRQVKVDKIYLETHRDTIVAEKETLENAIRFFEARNIEVAGGITLTVSERNWFETYCYSNPEHRKKIREIVEYTAGLFDELILDDFFFTNCKCERCIREKGERSWTEFRLDQLTRAAKELVIGPAKAVNPDIKVVIKYPNWYAHFQGLGFNLETGPKMFDGIYTGTETRDRTWDQHLQQYLGYSIFRYFENLKPGGNGGGWVDTPGPPYLDRYAEQLWLTLFAKAPEITLFDYSQLLQPIPPTGRAAWQGQGTSFDWETMMQPVLQADGSTVRPTTMARAAGCTLEQTDGMLGELGNPVGLKSYKPYHSTGEDYLHTYLGMIGIPIDLRPEFPRDAQTVAANGMRRLRSRHCRKDENAPAGRQDGGHYVRAFAGAPGEGDRGYRGDPAHRTKGDSQGVPERTRPVPRSPYPHSPASVSHQRYVGTGQRCGPERFGLSPAARIGLCGGDDVRPDGSG